MGEVSKHYPQGSGTRPYDCTQGGMSIGAVFLQISHPLCVQTMELPQTQEFNYNGPRRWKEPTTVFDRITFDPKIMGGRACIRGMRIPVSVVVGQIAHGAAME